MSYFKYLEKAFLVDGSDGGGPKFGNIADYEPEASKLIRDLSTFFMSEGFTDVDKNKEMTGETVEYFGIPKKKGQKYKRSEREEYRLIYTGSKKQITALLYVYYFQGDDYYSLELCNTYKDIDKESNFTSLKSKEKYVKALQNLSRGIRSKDVKSLIPLAG